MRAAPVVQAALASGRRERMFITLLHALAGAHVATWFANEAEIPTAALFAAAAGAAAVMASLGAVLARRALPVRPAHLLWDGQAWRLQLGHDLQVIRLVTALDLGVWMLLKLHLAEHARPCWQVASARAAGGAWHGLRVAVAAHAGALPVQRRTASGSAR